MLCRHKTCPQAKAAKDTQTWHTCLMCRIHSFCFKFNFFLSKQWLSTYQVDDFIENNKECRKSWQSTEYQCFISAWKRSPIYPFLLNLFLFLKWYVIFQFAHHAMPSFLILGKTQCSENILYIIILCARHIIEHYILHSTYIHSIWTVLSLIPRNIPHEDR